MKNQLVNWWISRESREHMMLGGGALVVVAILLYALVWEPIAQARNRLADQMPGLRTQAARFHQEAIETERLKGVARSSGPGPGLQSAIDQAAQRANVKPVIKQIQTLGRDRAQVSLSGPVAFDSFARFVADMATNGGVSIDTVQMRAADPGRVTIDSLVVKLARSP